MPPVSWKSDSFTKTANKGNRSECLQFYVEVSARRKIRHARALKKTAVETAYEGGRGN
jgi:hypothetical protein